jgi:hypothetical protein
MRDLGPSADRRLTHPSRIASVSGGSPLRVQASSVSWNGSPSLLVRPPQWPIAGTRKKRNCPAARGFAAITASAYAIAPAGAGPTSLSPLHISSLPPRAKNRTRSGSFAS